MSTRQSPAPNQSNLSGKIFWDQGTVGALNTNTTNIAVKPTSDGGQPSELQAAINTLSDLGGGTIILPNGTYMLDSSIEIPSLITLEGESTDGVIIDFGNQPYNISMIGSNSYTDGTVAVNNNSTTVTGTATSWNTGMIGQTIILSGIFFVITDVASATSLTIESAFDSPDVSGDSYAIFDAVSGSRLRRFTVQNSTHANGAIYIQYSSFGSEDVTCISSTYGFNCQDCSFGNMEGITVIACTTGINFNNCGVWTLTDWAAYSGTTNVAFNRFISASVNNATVSSASGNGFTITNSSNMSIYDMTVTTNGGKGLELTSSNDIQVEAMYIANNGSDGVKLTATSDRCILNSLALTKNGGYGINIANSNCDNNIIADCVFNTNTSGTYSNSGTGTVIMLESSGVSGIGNILYPIGIIIELTVSTNPNTLFGFGTWAYYGEGRVSVGVQGGGGTFGSAGATGGEETHILTTSEMPAHTHTIGQATIQDTGSGTVVATTGAGGATTSSTGDGGAHNNLQPYIVIYRWTRTA